MGDRSGLIRCRRAMHPRRGAMLVLVAVAVVLLLVGAVFSVDVAYMFMAREQLKVATDAAAKAAVVTLAQGSTSTQATATAVKYAGLNQVCGSTLTLAPANVSLGRVVYAENGAWAFSAGGSPLIAAQVTGSVSSPLFLAPVLGTKTFATHASSTAAFVRNKWCLVFDRSGSMCFDMSGNDWYFPNPTATPSGSTSLYLYGYVPPNYRQKQNYYPAYPWPATTAPNPAWPRTYMPSETYSRLGNLYTGATTFLDALTNSPGGTASNKVGMVTFADSANTDCQFTSTYSGISSQLYSYLTRDIWTDGIANGNTNMSAGLQAAINMFDSDPDKTVWNKIIIIFSDGDWKTGFDPVNGGSPTIVSQANSKSITIYTVGLLPKSNNSTMQDLASKTGGKFYYVTDPAGVQAAFKALAQTIPVILTQ